MLITHVRPTELWGKGVYDTDGRYLGSVVAIASRRGVVRKVVVQRTRESAEVSLPTPSDSLVDGSSLVVPVVEPSIRPRLRVVR
jgi:sporulation protein YlmC with PRC-barrel domain